MEQADPEEFVDDLNEFLSDHGSISGP